LAFFIPIIPFNKFLYNNMILLILLKKIKKNCYIIVVIENINMVCKVCYTYNLLSISKNLYKISFVIYTQIKNIPSPSLPSKTLEPNRLLVSCIHLHRYGSMFCGFSGLFRGFETAVDNPLDGLIH
jgi:hypothetical protein